MFSSSMPSRARLAGLAGLAVTMAVGGLLAAPTAVQAAVLTTPTHQADVSFDDNPTATTCTQTGAGDVTSTGPFAADGVPVTRTASSSATITDDGNASDITTLAGTSTSTVTASQAGGQLSHVSVKSTFTSTLTAAIANQKCNAEVDADGVTIYNFDLVTPTLVTVSFDAHHMIGIVEAGQITGPITGDQHAVVIEAIGPHATGSASVLLPAGTAYIGVSESFNELVATAAAGTTSQSGDSTTEFSFDTPGIASTGQTGAGGKYLTMGSGRTCAAGSLSATWSKKAGKGKHRAINKATVSVNGVKVATVKKPKKDQVTTLTGLNPEKAVQVQVVLKVKGKGQQFVQRSYLPCS